MLELLGKIVSAGESYAVEDEPCVQEVAQRLTVRLDSLTDANDGLFSLVNKRVRVVIEDEAPAYVDSLYRGCVPPSENYLDRELAELCEAVQKPGQEEEPNEKPGPMIVNNISPDDAGYTNYIEARRRHEQILALHLMPEPKPEETWRDRPSQL